MVGDLARRHVERDARRARRRLQLLERLDESLRLAQHTRLDILAALTQALAVLEHTLNDRIYNLGEFGVALLEHIDILGIASGRFGVANHLHSANFHRATWIEKQFGEKRSTTIAGTLGIDCIDQQFDN
jgi:hypothetical protein